MLSRKSRAGYPRENMKTGHVSGISLCGWLLPNSHSSIVVLSDIPCVTFAVIQRKKEITFLSQ